MLTKASQAPSWPSRGSVEAALPAVVAETALWLARVAQVTWRAFLFLVPHPRSSRRSSLQLRSIERRF
jgi:hypothetical protein